MTDKNKDQTKTKKTKNQDKKQAEEKSKQSKQPDYVAENSSIKITIPWEEAKSVFQKVLEEEKKDLKIKGFRKGKAPVDLAEKEIGLPKLYNHTLQHLIPKYYPEAIKDSGKKPISEPEFRIISVNKDNDWIIEAVFAQKPEIELNNYKKIVKQAKKEAEDNVEEAEKKAQEARKKQEKKAKKDKEEETEEKKETQQEKQGLTDKQKKDIVLQTVFNKLIQELEPKVPQILIKQNTQRELRNLNQRLKQLNVDLEDYVKSQNMSKQQLTQRLAQSSLNQLQVEFLLNAIADKEELEVSEDEVEERIEEVEDEEMKKKMEQDKNYQNYLKSVMLKQKVMDYLLEI